jgi:hypothetical protein
MLPSEFTVADTYGTLAADTAAVKAAAVVPTTVAVTGAVRVSEPAALALMLNVVEVTNTGVVVVPVVVVAPTPAR